MATDPDTASESLNEVRRGSTVIEDTGAKVLKVRLELASRYNPY